jgi:hypothetical protein
MHPISAVAAPCSQQRQDGHAKMHLSVASETAQANEVMYDRACIQPHTLTKRALHTNNREPGQTPSAICCRVVLHAVTTRITFQQGDATGTWQCRMVAQPSHCCKHVGSRLPLLQTNTKPHLRRKAKTCQLLQDDRGNSWISFHSALRREGMRNPSDTPTTGSPTLHSSGPISYTRLWGRERRWTDYNASIEESQPPMDFNW